MQCRITNAGKKNIITNSVEGIAIEALEKVISECDKNQKMDKTNEDLEEEPHFINEMEYKYR